jgi:hypothetical protein
MGYFELLTTDRDPDEKIFHNSKPAITNTGYGKSPEGTFNALPKNIEKTIVIRRG